MKIKFRDDGKYGKVVATDAHLFNPPYPMTCSLSMAEPTENGEIISKIQDIPGVDTLCGYGKFGFAFVYGELFDYSQIREDILQVLKSIDENIEEIM